MTSTLREFYADAAPLMGQDVSARSLYEYEIALREHGIMEAGRRGPGGGPDLTADAVATVLLAFLVADVKRDAARRIAGGLDALLTPRGIRCRLTGGTIFHEVLALVLADLDIARRVTELTVNRSWDSAVLLFDNGKRATHFVAPGCRSWRDPPDGVSGRVIITAMMTGACLRSLSQFLARHQADARPAS